ncbi:hypothetical protein ACOSQ3_014474 [Xanthoceras sorbifolium]
MAQRGGENRGVGGKTVKAHGNAGRKQESDGKKVSNEIDRRTGNKAKASLRNVVQGGMTNRSRSEVSSNTKTQKKGSRFNVLEEQPDEVMEIETIECPEEKVNSSALKDGKGTVGSAGTGRRGKGVVAKY